MHRRGLVGTAAGLVGTAAAAPSIAECTPRGKTRLVLLLLLGVPLLLLSVAFCSGGSAPEQQSARQGAVAVQPAPAQLMGSDEAQTELQAPHLELGFAAKRKSVGSFPSVANSTILFLHVFKCAGTSLREVLINWAREAGWSGAVVTYCRNVTLDANVDRICLNSQNDLAEPLGEKWLVKGSKLMAGHFLWDFRRYVTPPYLMVTTLRSPLELFVSSQQYMHKDETSTLADSVAFVSASMRSRLTWEDPSDLAFIRRFLDQETANDYVSHNGYTREEHLAMAQTAVTNLNTFFVVGVVEQYRGFIEVLKHSLDPAVKHPSLWETAVEVKNNGSPVHSGDVLQSIDPDLVRKFNATCLEFQWKVYDVALQLWDNRCREVLPVEDHDVLCTVPAHR